MKNHFLLSILMLGNVACTTIAYDIETEVTFADSAPSNDPRINGKHIVVEQTINHETPLHCVY